MMAESSLDVANKSILKRFRMGQYTKAIAEIMKIHEAEAERRLHLAMMEERWTVMDQKNT